MAMESPSRLFCASCGVINGKNSSVRFDKEGSDQWGVYNNRDRLSLYLEYMMRSGESLSTNFGAGSEKQFGNNAALMIM